MEISFLGQGLLLSNPDIVFRDWWRTGYDFRSGDSDCFCRPRSSSTYTGSSRRRFLPPPCTAIFLLFVVSVVAALFSLTYFAISLHGQISALTMHLEAGEWFRFDFDSFLAKESLKIFVFGSPVILLSWVGFEPFTTILAPTNRSTIFHSLNSN